MKTVGTVMMVVMMMTTMVRMTVMSTAKVSAGGAFSRVAVASLLAVCTCTLFIPLSSHR